MGSERSDSVFAYHRAASEKFDYFVTGLTGALCAYISQTFTPERISLSPASLELAALLILVASVFAGFKRIEISLVATRYNAHTLRLQEQRGQLVSKLGGSPLVNSATGEILSPVSVQTKIQVITEVLPEFDKNATDNSEASGNWYHARNWLLMVGFLMLVASRVWHAYL